MITFVVRTFLFSILAILCSGADIIQKFDPADINQDCAQKSGTFKLEVDCPTKHLPVQGYLIGYGAVVCCTTSSNNVNIINTLIKKRQKGDAARDFCNTKVWKKPIELDFHILNGKEAQVGEFPHMVAIYSLDISNKSEFICGGSLISETFIVTAAHCFKNKRTASFFVRMGRTSIDLSDIRDTNVAVDRIIDNNKIRIPKGYTSANKYKDIALIEMDNPVMFSNSVKPVCLEVDADATDENRNFTIIGYGRIDTDRKIGSDWLMYADVKEYGLSECDQKYNELKKEKEYILPQGVLRSQICALGRAKTSDQPAADTCQGDSGGSLLHFNDNDSKYRIVGITSFGLSCGNPGFPSIYTRVVDYIDWIEDIVWPR